MTILPNAIPAKRPDAFSETKIDNEYVLMVLETGEFLSLAGTGATIWALIDSRRSHAAILDSLAGQYDAPRAEIAADCAAFLDELAGLGLIGER